MIKFINSHQQALEDHSNVNKNASVSETMQNANMYNAYAQCNYQTQKTKEEQTRPTKLTKEKSAIERGNKTKAPIASEQKCPAQAVW